MSKYFNNFLFFLFLLSFSVKSQNLVQNGGFEDYYPKKGKGCPEAARGNDKNVKLVPHWTWPTIDGTTDYFNACSKGKIVDVPKNFAGISPAKDGNAYVGFILKTKRFKKGKNIRKDYREYLQTQLSEKLKPGQDYCVSLFYRLANCSAFSIDKLGIFFSPVEVKVPTRRTLNYKPQITSNIGYMDNNNEWTVLHEIYKADGSEEFLLIGNFSVDAETQEKTREKVGRCDKRKNYAYYYIDSVSVTQLNGNCEPCTCIPQDLEVNISDGNCFNGATDLTASITGGTKPYKAFKWENDLKEEFFKGALTGEHIATVRDDWNCLGKATFNVDCGYPLEVKIANSGFDGGNTGFIDLEITGGIKPFKIKWENGQKSKSIKDLSYGEYKYTVTDSVGVVVKGNLKFALPLEVSVKEKHYEKGSDGFIKLSIIHGLEPYKIEWSNGAKTQDIENLSFGEYIYKVTDSKNNSRTDTVIFIESLSVIANANYTDNNDGSIFLEPKGGTEPYTYSWKRGDITNNLDSLSAGVYVYTVKDAENRVVVDSVHFIEPIKVELEIGYTFETDGFINMKIKGGCPPYSVIWSNEETKTELKFLDNGLYEYSVEGSCGKTKTDTARIRGSITLNGVLFASGSDKLKTSSFKELDLVVAYMKRKNKLKVEISGHTDSQGADDKNQKLSEKRAKSVVNYIVKKGVEETRLVYKGYGEEKPVATNDTKEGRKLNRRVEFNILE